MRDLPRYFANRGFIELFKIYVGLLIHHKQSCALLVVPLPSQGKVSAVPTAAVGAAV